MAADVISLLDADPDFADGLDPDTAQRARRDARTRVQRLSPGAWDAAAAMEPETHHRGFLIVDGLLAREVDVLGRSCCELLGPGDVMRPWQWDPEGSHELFSRGIRRAHALAISHHQRVDDRLKLTLWHLAERWGRVTPDGVVVPLPLNHERLALLVVLHGTPPERLRHHRLAAALT